MKWSYWERETWFKDLDLAVIGSGIVGLTTAIYYKQKHPDKKVVVLEKGSLPKGASTKNAGFACFGSVSEILSDLNTHSHREVVDLIEKRWKGLTRLRSLLGDQNIDYKNWGGYELFTDNQEELYQQCLTAIPEINELLQPVFGKEVFRTTSNDQGFQKVQDKLLFNSVEGQINTGSMMSTLLSKAREVGVEVFFGLEVEAIESGSISLAQGDKIQANKIAVCTNGFGSKWIGEEVVPARAQVLITKPIPNLKIQGTFHLDEGYYYFRNIDNRVLLGGGRNLDFQGEKTDEFGFNNKIQDSLTQLLEDSILPGQKFEVDSRWTGIMGVGSQKSPIIRELEPNVFCGLRLGGMGVALGSEVGYELSNLL